MFIGTTTPGKVLEFGTDIPSGELFINFGPNVFAGQLKTKFGNTYNSKFITLAGYIDIINPFSGNDNRFVVSSTGTTNAINLEGSGCTVTNAGYVGVVTGGENFRLINSGTMTSHTGGGLSFIKSGTVVNSGTMSTYVDVFTNPDTAVQFSSASNAGSVINSGLIDGQIRFGAASSSLKNSASGSIDGQIIFGANSDSLINAGFISGNIKTGAGNNVIINDGFMDSNITGGAATDTVVNTGFLNSNISVGAGNDSIVNNNGRIDGNLTMSTGADVVDNSYGQIRGIIDLGVDADKFRGGQFSEFVIGGLGADEVDLAGGNDRYNAHIDGGGNTVDGGEGIDTYDMLSFTARGILDLRLDWALQSGTSQRDSVTGFENIVGSNFSDFLIGNGVRNILTGGAGNDRIDGLGGNDVISGGGGKDSLQGGDGDDVFVDNYSVGDTVDGGIGSDTLTFNSKALDLENVPPIYKITNIENIRAGGADVTTVVTIKGDANNNYFLGLEDFKHEFEGRAGNDTLDGGGGADTLTGGTGADVLVGGAGADVFRYATTGDSDPELSESPFTDTILDFGAGDRIDVSPINANSDVGFDVAFTFLATEGAAIGETGQLRFRYAVIDDEQYTIVEGNVDPNVAPDFQINLLGTIALTSSNFIL